MATLESFDLHPCPRCGRPVRMDYASQYANGGAPWRMLCRECGTQARGFTRDSCRELWNTWRMCKVLEEEDEDRAKPSIPIGTSCSMNRRLEYIEEDLDRVVSEAHRRDIVTRGMSCIAIIMSVVAVALLVLS